MKRWERWTFNILSLVVAVTGFVYLWMKYLLEQDDPFALVNHPWQNAMLDVHVVASPLFILISGIVLNSHIMKKLRSTARPNRRTGLTSLVTFAAMVGSGYLLQVVSSPGWLQALVVLHVASGVVFSAAYATHLVISARIALRRQDSVIREVA